jgi:hypothetical protein
MTRPGLKTPDMRSEAMPLGDGLTVTFALVDGAMEVAFAPRPPRGRKARRYLPAYRRARDEFLRRLSLKTGLTVGVLEI